MKSAAYSDGTLQEYAYDAIGNRLAFTILPNQTMTVTTLTSAPNPSTHGDTVTLTATVTGSDTAPTGTMSFSDSGDQTYSASSGTTSHTVNQAVQTIIFAPLGDKALGDADFTLSATASSGPTEYA